MAPLSLFDERLEKLPRDLLELRHLLLELAVLQLHTLRGAHCLPPLGADLLEVVLHVVQLVSAVAQAFVLGFDGGVCL